MGSLSRSMRARVATLMGMIASGNDKFQAGIDKLNGEGHFAPPAPRQGLRSFFRKGAPGRVRKKGPNAYMKPRKRNGDRRIKKPLMGGWAHGSTVHGRLHAIPAPTQDQVRALETRTGFKMRVMNGKCYLRIMGLKSTKAVPLEATKLDINKMFEIAGTQTGRC